MWSRVDEIKWAMEEVGLLVAPKRTNEQNTKKCVNEGVMIVKLNVIKDFNVPFRRKSILVFN